MQNCLKSESITHWSAAKYLSYAFWRAWFLVMYSSPLWLNLVSSDVANPGLQMHYISTVCFIVASIVFSIFHTKTVEILSVRWIMLAFGALASTGVAMEYVSLLMWHDPSNGLFWLGSALTGVFTAPIALRAGQIYSSVPIKTAFISTLLSDVAAGLIFFFCIGTWPVICLFIAAVLPLLSAAMAVVSEPSLDDITVDSRAVDSGKKAYRSFLRFLVVVFLIGAIAFLQNGLGNSWFPQADINRGLTLGVSLLVMVSFVLAIAFMVVQKMPFEKLYRPIVFCLITFVLAAYLVDFGNPIAIAGTFLVYCLFSSYIWCFMAYLGHSRYFSPIQIFGYGRSVYSGGSLAGCLLGVYVFSGIDLVQTLPVVVIAMVATLLLCAIAIRRVDISSILVEDGGAIQDKIVANSPKETSEQNQGLNGVRLSPRELEVFALMKAGRDSEYIARSLCVSRNTAKTHIRNIYTKFGVHKRQDFIDVIQDL